MLNIGTTQAAPAAARSRIRDSVSRVFKYTAVRGITLLVTVVIAVYLTILIANGGGYVDEMRKGQIREQVALEITVIYRESGVQCLESFLRILEE